MTAPKKRPAPEPDVTRTWPPLFCSQLVPMIRRDKSSLQSAGVSIANQRLRESEELEERLKGMRAMRGLSRASAGPVKPRKETA